MKVEENDHLKKRRRWVPTWRRFLQICEWVSEHWKALLSPLALLDSESSRNRESSCQSPSRQRLSDNFEDSRSHGRRGAVRDRAERVRKARTPRLEAQVLGRQRRPPRPPLIRQQRRRRDHRLRPSLPLSHRPPPPARDLPHLRIILSLSWSRFNFLFWVYLKIHFNLFIQFHVIMVLCRY